MAEISEIPTMLPVFFSGAKERLLPGEAGVSAKVTIDAVYNTHIHVPPAKVVKKTDSVDIFRGKPITLVFTSTQDGRINPSGRISKKMIKKAGKDVLFSTFTEAAEKLWDFASK